MSKHHSGVTFRVCSAVLFALAAVSIWSQSPGNVPLPSAATADKVVVLKGERKLLLMERGEVLKEYSVSLGGNPVGPKVKRGDSRTPEGIYVLDLHNPNSQYHRSIHISYPNREDLARARRLGVPAGGDLFIHGLPNDYHGRNHHLGDWTEGCIALDNADMDEIWRAVADGTPIEIRP
jgi:murein L,D-transpeptidase YafK